MRIRRKIAFGYLVLIVLLLLILLYQYGLAQRMLTGIQQFSEVDRLVSKQSIASMQSADGLQEFLYKFLATQDYRYHPEVVARMQDLDEGIHALAEFRLTPGLRQELELLEKQWVELLGIIYPKVQSRPVSPERYDVKMLRPVLEHEIDVAMLQPILIHEYDFEMLQPVLEDQFEILKRHAERIFDETDEAVEDRADKLEALGEQARQFALTVLAIGLALSLLLSFLVVRSVSKPLLQLTRGTRRLAKGDFTVLVDESGKDELAELAAHFNKMVSRLGELDQLKGDFVSHVSHELKAPLASMQETTRLLMDEIPGGLNEKQRRLLQLNLACSERLSEMIKNLLDLSTIEADAMQYNFEITDLAATVRRAVDEFRGLAVEKDLSLEVELPEESPLIPCDEERCVQVLGNLISNAIKFSTQGEVIKVKVQCVDTPPQVLPEAARHRLMSFSNRFCVLSVRDRGHGVSDEDKERIFERFFVLAKGRKNFGQGTGLGLAISRKIAEAHSGLLWVEDNPGGGSIFSFLLPDRGV